MSRRKEISICNNCGKIFHAQYTSFSLYCTLKCQQEYQTKLKVEKWLNGEDNPINTNGLLRPWARRYIFKIFNNKCCICGWNEINNFTGKIPLEVDHIDGNYKNNKLNNLRLLCPNCHSLSSNYKNLNKGKGRGRRKF